MSKKTGFLIVFSLKKGLNNKQRAKFFRELYGYNDYSQNNKYFYIRESILSKNVRYYSPIRAVLIVRKEDRDKLLSFLKPKAKVIVWEIQLNESDIKELYKDEL